VTLGGRYGLGSIRLDAAVVFGVTPIDPSIGVTAGFTYIFRAFSLPSSSDRSAVAQRTTGGDRRADATAW
jgi:hypothetical protein